MSLFKCIFLIDYKYTITIKVLFSKNARINVDRFCRVQNVESFLLRVGNRDKLWERTFESINLCYLIALLMIMAFSFSETRTRRHKYETVAARLYNRDIQLQALWGRT